MRSRGFAYILGAASLITAGAVATLPIGGGDYEIYWSSIDVGGGMASGGTYDMGITYAQPDARHFVIFGGNYTLQGGFWPGEFVGTDCNDNGIEDDYDIFFAASTDANDNGVPDECEAFITVDVKPEHCPNLLNAAGNGAVEVALLGSATFDVGSIDLSSIRISRTDGIGALVEPYEGESGPGSGALDDVATPFVGSMPGCHDVGGDGFIDVIVYFASGDLAQGLQLGAIAPGNVVELVVSGLLENGEAFAAHDVITLTSPAGPGSLEIAAVDSDGANLEGAWIDLTPFDLALDGGGFGSFTRSFGSPIDVVLSAPPVFEGSPFIGWRIDGVFHPARGAGSTDGLVSETASIDPEPAAGSPYSMSITVAGEHEIEAVYSGTGGLSPLAP
jgi:hypothetical protein